MNKVYSNFNNSWCFFVGDYLKIRKQNFHKWSERGAFILPVIATIEQRIKHV